jgi:ATP-citrate lyase alpha-subunit
MFSLNSHAIIYGRHPDVAERMLDFDFLSGRTPSVAGFVDPSARRKSVTKIFFWEKEILIPIYPSFSAIPRGKNIDTLINLASHRSAIDVTWEAIESGIFQTIVIIAEGIPERDIREVISWNEWEKNGWKKWIRIIWPATAGAIVWGILRMGNAWGSLENIVASWLYRKGSVGFVSKSGGMSNEMYRVISKRTDGIQTGIALGGDRFTGSVFRDIVTEYASDPEISMIVMLGEVGGRDELEIAEMIERGEIQKPVVAYVSGSFAEHLTTEVQFGHAGAKANAQEESASYKNEILRKSWAHVPESYLDFWDLIEWVYRSLGREEKAIDRASIEEKLKIIKNRRSTLFTSTISDERGEDVTYNGTSLSEYVSDGSIARVIANLWLKRDLPAPALDFLNSVIIILADHGPAVSGAMNTIVTTRAGKDILSSLVAGLMTIGPRFGGAIDGAARVFYEAVKSGETPEALITRMKREGTPIPGIGHKVKSKWNPDGRCTILREKAKNISKDESYGRYLAYALEVEALTLEKKSNLILNVDGHIATILLDIFESIGMDDDEITLYIEAGIFNAFFILARSIGFIGHALDQKRLGEPLYRSEWAGIHYGE